MPDPFLMVLEHSISKLLECTEANRALILSPWRKSYFSVGGWFILRFTVNFIILGT